jgi:hypothetical protein
MSVPDRRDLLNREGGALSLRRQCALLGLARSGIYRTPRAANDNDLALMRRIARTRSGSPISPTVCLVPDGPGERMTGMRKRKEDGRNALFPAVGEHEPKRR